MLHPTPKAMLMIALLQAPLMLGACTSTPELTAATSSGTHNNTVLVADSSFSSEQHLIFADLISWLSDPQQADQAAVQTDAQTDSQTESQPSTQAAMAGPQLAAGDWLAFQCAIAGGYWDRPSGPYAPEYAKAPTHAPMVD